MIVFIRRKRFDVMMGIFFEMPLWFRVLNVLLIAIFVWRILGKLLLKILSIIPFTLGKVFLLLYYIIELPITKLHKEIGKAFFEVDNFVADTGAKIDGILKKWYLYWSKEYKFSWKRAILYSGICWLIIVFPSLSKVESEFWRTGERWYLQGEKIVVCKLEEGFMEAATQDVREEWDFFENVQHESVEVQLVVAGVNTSLLVRDVPDLDGTTLEQLHNNDIVTWTGELVFAEVENNRIETWAKVITGNGVSGWSRLHYLHPVEYENRIFMIREEK